MPGKKAGAKRKKSTSAVRACPLVSAWESIASADTMMRGNDTTVSMKHFGLVVGSALGGVAMTLLVQWGRKRIAAKKPPKKKTPPGELLDPDYGFRFVRVKGLVYPPWANDQEESIDELRSQNWLVPGDIVVATYPKAGTTLMQQVVMLLLNQGDPERVGDVMVTSPWVEREYCTANDRAKAFDKIKGMTTGGGSRRVLKTHAPFELFPAASIPAAVSRHIRSLCTTDATVGATAGGASDHCGPMGP